MVGGTDTLSLKLNNSMTLHDAAAFCDLAKLVLADSNSDTVWIDAVANEVIELPILQVFFHGYGLENLKQITNKKTFYDESLRIREGVSALIERL